MHRTCIIYQSLYGCYVLDYEGNQLHPGYLTSAEAFALADWLDMSFEQGAGI
jgi:hypothetical protein